MSADSRWLRPWLLRSTALASGRWAAQAAADHFMALPLTDRQTLLYRWRLEAQRAAQSHG